ncbi:hypothetical protein CC2G_009325 [Coprinopsis cinerea AmutBmut pab1-1]|nr:hypothetical protein CC2G_009325 [Coprinopsis cinerea AmutBmut pab1-1]
MSPTSPSRTLEARREVSSSEAAALQGKPAKTPIIAGVVCGVSLFLAWVIGFAIYFRKRYNRKKRKRLAEEGKCDPPPEKLNPNASTERFIIPPDPAVLMGIAKPGEMVHTSKSRQSSEGSGKKSHRKSHSRSRPGTPRRTTEQDDMTEPLNPHTPPTLSIPS